MTRLILVHAWAIAALSLAACGGEAQGTSGDSGTHVDATTADGAEADGRPPPADGAPHDAHSDSLEHHDTGSTAMGGGPVDAGYYFGDGSFWVEGGAYPDLPDGSVPDVGVADAAMGDASPGCGALSACCATLTASSQALCETIAGAGNATNCATELAQLESEGNCTGVTILASKVQVAPNRMVSDGKLLFWTTTETPGLLAMPVGGGPITILLDGPFNNDYKGVDNESVFLAVDDVNVYVLEGHGVTRIPKDGSAATLVNESGAVVMAATMLGSTAYWLENAAGSGYGNPNAAVAVKSGPLLGSSVSLIAKFKYPGPPPNDMAVTSGAIFAGEQSVALFGFPMTGVPSGGPMMITSAGPMFSSCNFLTSDTTTIYCAETTGSNLGIANDGAATPLGPAVSSSYIVFDDAYVYWVDMTSVGTIMKAPKAGGGTATVIANDTSPTALAVDSRSVYWSDVGGYIKSIPK
jgi:hypothetical protein